MSIRPVKSSMHTKPTDERARVHSWHGSIVINPQGEPCQVLAEIADRTFLRGEGHR